MRGMRWPTVVRPIPRKRRRVLLRYARIAALAAVAILVLFLLIRGLGQRGGAGALLRATYASAPDGSLYLTYQPSGGLSNQLQSLLHALHLAAVLGRTLVLPHVLDGEQGVDNPQPLGSVVDLAWLRDEGGVPVIPITEFLQHNPRPQYMAVEVHKPDDGQKRSFLQSGTGGSYDYFQFVGLVPERGPLRVRSLRYHEGGFQDQEIVTLFGDRPFANVSLLAFTYVYYITAPEYFPPNLEGALRFVPPIHAAAQDVIRALGGAGQFDCLHLRLGDFLKYCDFIVDEGDIAAGEKANVCSPPLPCLGRRLAQHFLAGSPTSRPLFVSTNAPPSTVAEELRPHLEGRRTATLRDFDVTVRKHGAVLAGAVDQLVCAEADAFVGNAYSSFSVRISRMRELAGRRESRFLGDTQELRAYHTFGSVGYWRTRLTSHVPQLCE